MANVMVQVTTLYIIPFVNYSHFCKHLPCTCCKNQSFCCCCFVGVKLLEYEAETLLIKVYIWLRILYSQEFQNAPLCRIRSCIYIYHESSKVPLVAIYTQKAQVNICLPEVSIHILPKVCIYLPGRSCDKCGHRCTC